MALPDLTNDRTRFYQAVTFGEAGFAVTRFLFERTGREATVEITWTHATTGRSVTYRFRDVVPQSLWPLDPTQDFVRVEHVGHRQWETPKVLRVTQAEPDEMHPTMFYAASVEQVDPPPAPGAR